MKEDKYKHIELGMGERLSIVRFSDGIVCINSNNDYPGESYREVSKEYLISLRDLLERIIKESVDVPLREVGIK